MTERADALPVPDLTVPVDLPAPTREQRRRLRRPWLLGIAVWSAAAVALNLSPLGHELNPYLSITGLFVGFLVGLTGMGGGALLTPILIFLFGFQPSLAIGTDIAYAAITKVFGSWRHLKQGSVDRRVALWLALGSVPAGVLGATAVNFIKQNYGDAIDAVLYRAVGERSHAGRRAARRAVAAQGRQGLPGRRTSPVYGPQGRDRGHRRLDRLSRSASRRWAAARCSPCSSSSSIRWRPRRVVGTDVFHATILLGATGLAQLRFGNVDLWMVAAPAARARCPA